MSKTTLRRGSRSCGISTTISTIVFSPWYGGKKHQQHGCSWSLFGVIVVFRKDVTSSLPALLRFYLCRRGAKGRPDTWACERCGMFFPQGDTVHGSDIRRENHRWDGAKTPEKSMGFKRPNNLNCSAGFRTNHQQGFFYF